MTCAPFDVRAASVDGLVKTLVGADGDGDGKILAGGRKLPTTCQWPGSPKSMDAMALAGDRRWTAHVAMDLTITPTVQLKRAGLRRQKQTTEIHDRQQWPGPAAPVAADQLSSAMVWARACNASSRILARSSAVKTPLTPEIVASFIPCLRPSL